MAADDARAQRIRETWLERKAENPRKFTWGRIAGFVGTTERAAQDWQKTGGIDYDNAKKLAKYLEVDFDWLWRGDPEEKETPDPFAGRQPAELAESLEQLHRKLDLILVALGVSLEAGPAAGPVPDRIPQTRQPGRVHQQGA